MNNNNRGDFVRGFRVGYQSSGQSWAGWLGRQAANGALLYLAFKLAQWMDVVVIVARCGS